MAGTLFSKLDPDLVIQEAMYGFIMALTLITTAQLDIIQYSSRYELILAIVGMDFVWGAIDMYVFYRVELMARSRRLHLYLRVRDMSDREEKISALKEEFNDTVFEMASDADRRKMLECFVDGSFTGLDSMFAGNRHYLFNAITAFVVTIATVIPSVLCLGIVDDYTEALLMSAVTSSIALFFVAYFMAPSDTKFSRIMTGLTTSVVCLILTAFAAYLGG